MKNRLATTTITVAVLLAVLTYSASTVIYYISNRASQNAYQTAQKQCAKKIPDSERSVTTASYDIPNPGGTGIFGKTITNYVQTAYSNYPSFDRCMAERGQLMR